MNYLVLITIGISLASIAISIHTEFIYRRIDRRRKEIERISDAHISLLYGEHPTPIEIKWCPDQATRPTNEPLTPDNHTGIKR